MNTTWTGAVLGVLLAPGAWAMDVSLGPVFGGQMMDETDYGSGHDGPIRLGRSALAGIEVALAMDDRVSVSLDAVAGPYRNDGYVLPNGDPGRRDVDFAVLVGSHLTWTGPGRVRPFAGVGFTVKAYNYADAVPYESRTAVGPSVRTGLERAGRVAAGLEVRWVRLAGHPMRYGLTQGEVQLRASVRFMVSGRH